MLHIIYCATFVYPLFDFTRKCNRNGDVKSRRDVSHKSSPWLVYLLGHDTRACRDFKVLILKCYSTKPFFVFCPKRVFFFVHLYFFLFHVIFRLCPQPVFSQPLAHSLLVCLHVLTVRVWSGSLRGDQFTEWEAPMSEPSCECVCVCVCVYAPACMCECF